MIFNKKALLGALTTLSVASAESCNPLKETDCAANKALGTSFTTDFTSESKYFSSLGNPGSINYTSDGLEVTINKRLDNPSLKSNFYIMYGKFSVIAKAGAGQGIISSVFLQSDDLDEIDVEWVGGDTTQFQSNFFSKGNVTTYDRGGFHTVSNPQEEFHNYTVDWRMDRTDFYLDGAVVRTIANNTSSGYPQSPMALFIGIWAGGDSSNPKGVIEWAGGATDYTKLPFSMYVKDIVVTDYSSGTEYSYADQSGSFQSIEAKNGAVYNRVSKAEEEFAALVNGDSISAEDADISTSSVAETSSVVETSSSIVKTSSSSVETSSSAVETSSSSVETSSSAVETSSSAVETSSSIVETSSSSTSVSSSFTVSNTTSHSTTHATASHSSHFTSITASLNSSSTHSVQSNNNAISIKTVSPFTVLITLLLSLF